LNVNSISKKAGTSQFWLSADGSVQFMDAQVTNSVAFAHITDLHWPPPPINWDEVNRKYRATSCNGSLRGLQTPFQQLQRELAGMLDKIQARGADFVLFGGDNMDCYHPQTARLMVTLCRERGLSAYFVMGNHDWDEEYPRGDVKDCPHRLVAQKYDRELRNSRARKLMTEDWQMSGLYYSFECKGIRFIILDTLHITLTEAVDDIASFYDEEQADWLIKQLEWDGPIIVAQHVPFSPVTPTYQPEAWMDLRGTVCEDDQGQRVRSALASCPNLLGIFVGHKHFRAEDPLGNTCQFMTKLSCENVYRYVKITNASSPEYLQPQLFINPGKGKQQKPRKGRSS